MFYLMLILRSMSDIQEQLPPEMTRYQAWIEEKGESTATEVQGWKRGEAAKLFALEQAKEILDNFEGVTTVVLKSSDGKTERYDVEIEIDALVTKAHVPA